MTEVISVRFRGGCKSYYFDPKGSPVKMGDQVIVETAQGLEFATCTEGNHEVEDSTIVKPLCVMLLIRRIFDWLRDTRLFGSKIVWLEQRANVKGEVVRKYRLLGLVILVAIPLPGTGAWTGALVADMLDIRMQTAIPAILLGLLISGGITTAVTCGVLTAL